MLDRILDPGTAEFLARQATEAMVGRAQPGMLSRQDEMRRDPRRGERVSKWSKLDSFWTRSND